MIAFSVLPKLMEQKDAKQRKNSLNTQEMIQIALKIKDLDALQ